MSLELRVSPLCPAHLPPVEQLYWNRRESIGTSSQIEWHSPSLQSSPSPAKGLQQLLLHFLHPHYIQSSSIRHLTPPFSTPNWKVLLQILKMLELFREMVQIFVLTLVKLPAFPSLVLGNGWAVFAEISPDQFSPRQSKHGKFQPKWVKFGKVTNNWKQWHITESVRHLELWE